jgi:predicted metal-dependent HD superfamily phosphohydrolase
MIEVKHWVDLCRSAGAKGDPVYVLARVTALYSEPHRAYHTLQHVAHCLREFRAVARLAKRPLEVEMAIWFHDAVYDTHATDNEERSSDLAAQCLTALKLPVALIRRVGKLILATRHRAIPRDIDEKLLVDLDLAILGRPREEFWEYEHNVRREFEWVPEDQFRTARAKILQDFLDRSSIYFTEPFRKKYESRARKNLAESISRLTAPAGAAPKKR